MVGAPPEAAKLDESPSCSSLSVTAEENAAVSDSAKENASAEDVSFECENDVHKSIVDEEVVSVDRGSVISALGTCCSTNDEFPQEAKMNGISSIMLDPDSIPQCNKTPSLMNDERSMLSCSTRPDPPPSVVGDTDLLGDTDLIAASPESDSKNNSTEKPTCIDTRATSMSPPNVDEIDIVRQPRDASAASLPQENDWFDPSAIAEIIYNEKEESGSVTRLDEDDAQSAITDSMDTSAFCVPREAGTCVGPDNLVLLPAVDEERLQIPPPLPPAVFSMQQQHLMPHPLLDHPMSTSQFSTAASNNSERRKIQFRLQEDVLMKTSHNRTNSLLGSIRKSSTRMLRFGRSDAEPFPVYKIVDRGTIFVSWYPGTSTLELYQHTKRSVVRKMKLEGTSSEQIQDIRILDESSDPPEEIVLSPYIPDGSRFLLRFSLEKSPSNNNTTGMETPLSQYSVRPPVSPSAAPSPNPASRHIFGNLNEKQIALLGSLQQQSSSRKELEKQLFGTKQQQKQGTTTDETQEAKVPSEVDPQEKEEEDDDDEDDEDDVVLHSDDPVESALRELTERLLFDRRKNGRQSRQREKRQVIFVVANYFALFICLIFLSAELQARVPGWLKMMEDQLKNVRNCSENQEALFECVSRGDFAGLIASVGLWLSRSVVTKRIFLFGFDTPKKLWTVVYESLVTSICWGISYLFIRRGMNPDTRPRFVHKYWKDAVYGSLAGFNAAFLKQVLKNLIPQDVVEDAIRERQLKILGWLPSFA